MITAAPPSRLGDSQRLGRPGRRRGGVQRERRRHGVRFRQLGLRRRRPVHAGFLRLVAADRRVRLDRRQRHDPMGLLRLRRLRLHHLRRRRQRRMAAKRRRRHELQHLHQLQRERERRLDQHRQRQHRRERRPEQRIYRLRKLFLQFQRRRRHNFGGRRDGDGVGTGCVGLRLRQPVRPERRWYLAGRVGHGLGQRQRLDAMGLQRLRYIPIPAQRFGDQRFRAGAVAAVRQRRRRLHGLGGLRTQPRRHDVADHEGRLERRRRRRRELQLLRLRHLRHQLPQRRRSLRRQRRCDDRRRQRSGRLPGRPWRPRRDGLGRRHGDGVRLEHVGLRLHQPVCAGRRRRLAGRVGHGLGQRQRLDAMERQRLRHMPVPPQRLGRERLRPGELAAVRQRQNRLHGLHLLRAQLRRIDVADHGGRLGRGRHRRRQLGLCRLRLLLHQLPQRRRLIQRRRRCHDSGRQRRGFGRSRSSRRGGRGQWDGDGIGIEHVGLRLHQPLRAGQRQRRLAGRVRVRWQLRQRPEQPELLRLGDLRLLPRRLGDQRLRPGDVAAVRQRRGLLHRLDRLDPERRRLLDHHRRRHEQRQRLRRRRLLRLGRLRRRFDRRLRGRRPDGHRRRHR